MQQKNITFDKHASKPISKGAYKVAPFQRRTSAESLVTGSVNRNEYSRKCRYCANRHWSDECGEYKTFDERKKRLKGSCYICLKQGHTLEECRLSKLCVYCGKKDAHHRSLCPLKFTRRNTGRKSAHVINETTIALPVGESVSQIVLVSVGALSNI